MTTNTVLESATRDLEVLGNLVDGQNFIGLESSFICKDSGLKVLLLCLGSLLFDESLSLSVRHCREGDQAKSWWVLGSLYFCL